MIDLSPASLFISFVHVSVCIAAIPSRGALAPCLNLDATPRISMTSTLTFLPPKAASKQEGPLHDKSTSLASQMEMRFALLLFISSPFKLLISLLIYSFSFDVVTQEVARSNPPRFQNSLSVQEFYSTLAQLLHTKPFPVVRQGIATKKHAALATPSNKGIRRVFKALLCIMYI